MAANPPLARGTIFRARVDRDPLLGLVVSADTRNNQMDSVIYARVAEIQMPSFPNIVSLSDADPIEGIVMLDFISVVSVRDFTKGSLNPLGPVTDATLRAVDEALRVVLGITP